MAEKRLFPNRFCPMTKECCRTDCMWCYIENEITEDGIDEHINCALNVLAEAFMLGEIEEDYDG